MIKKHFPVKYYIYFFQCSAFWYCLLLERIYAIIGSIINLPAFGTAFVSIVLLWSFKMLSISPVGSSGFEIWLYQSPMSSCPLLFKKRNILLMIDQHYAYGGRFIAKIKRSAHPLCLYCGHQMYLCSSSHSCVFQQHLKAGWKSSLA